MLSSASGCGTGVGATVGATDAAALAAADADAAAEAAADGLAPPPVQAAITGPRAAAAPTFAIRSRSWRRVIRRSTM